MNDLQTLIYSHLRNVVSFAADTSGLKLRSYQERVARSIVESVRLGLGMTFVVIFPRQSGKNELQAQLETYLLTLYSQLNAEIVKVSPTWKPQSLNAMRRLERVLSTNLMTRAIWKKEQGYIYTLDTARIFFLSGSATANVVGATASTLLECDEAQDVTIAKWDKDINPMAASTNATRVFWGTAWTSQTLLAREKRLALEAEKKDGRQRVFMLTADDVRGEVPAYGAFVDGEIAKLGRNHPFVRTQFYSEEIDEQGGMFPPERRALMQGGHPPLTSPLPGELYAFLLDIAGEDESVSTTIFQDEVLKNSNRDSTALTIVRIDLSQLESLRAPRYQVVMRRLWTGVKHTTLFGQLLALAEAWSPRTIVCDSTGVGAGIASFMVKALGEGRVIPFIFTAKSKSELGWNFLSIIETGRYQEYVSSSDPYTTIFQRQLENCRNEILPGPGRTMRWSVPDGTRDPATGELIHDDLVISAALCSVLDEQTWGLARSEILPAQDPFYGFTETW